MLLLMFGQISCSYPPSNQFNEINKMIKLSENTEPGSPVYYIDQILPDTPLFPSATIFSKVAAFEYRPIDGSIILAKKLDRETICPLYEQKCFLVVKILLEPEEDIRGVTRGQKLLNLNIEVTDENDQSPFFQTDFSGSTLNLCKSALLNGISGNIFLANDYDKVSHLRYSLKGAPFLSLDEYTNSAGKTELKLSLDVNIAPESYEGPSQIVAQVSDGVHQVERSVLIDIDQGCDKIYTFQQKIYKAAIDENVRSMATGIMLQSDGLNEVTYTFIDPAAREYLKIDDETGEIHLVKSIDFERRQSLRTVVELRDLKTDAILDFAIVEISVRDVNDNPPQIKTTILPPSQLKGEKVIISESAQTGMALAYFDINDLDLASAGEIDLRLNMGEEYFDLRYGFLILTKQLDRESQNLIRVGIYACDNGRPKACSTEEVSFVISDDNDHGPEFSICPSNPIEVSEDSEPNKVLAIVRATDGDYLSGQTSIFGVVEYHSLDSIVTVFPNSGRVVLNERLDREIQDLYTFQIEARDGGTPPKKAKCEMKLKVIDVNDNTPVFHEVPAIMTISNTAPKNFVVHQFLVTDADEGENGRVSLALTESYDLFDIDNDGFLTLNRNITTDDKTEYNLRIVATDHGVENLNAPAFLMVEIVSPEVLSQRSDPAIISGALAGLGLVFLILILIIVIKCMRNKKREIYKFRSAENSLGDCVVGDSKQTLSGWTVEINGTDNVKTGLIVEPTASEGNRTSEYGYGVAKSDVTKKSRERDGSSDMVPDSGRGESEKDSISSGNCGLNGAMGPSCTKECLFQGHSDACWMPPANDSRDDQAIDTLNSSLIGYSKERFSKLSHQYINTQQKIVSHALVPSSDQTSQRSSGYLSSNDGHPTRSIHYC